MVLATVQQTSFNGGEISESLYGRTDLTKYDTSVRLMKNFIPTLQGNVVNRPGTQFVAMVLDPSKNSRLIPFQFSVTQAYVLEFGDEKMRIIYDGGLVVYPTGHASAGDPVEVTTPYDHTDLDRIQFAQSADVLYLVHPEYPPQRVSRLSATDWTCETIPFGSSAGAPTGLASGAVGTAFYYVVTAIIGSEESLQSATAGSSSQTSTLTWTAVFGADYYNVYKLRNGTYGWIGEAVGASFTDATITGDLAKRPPTGKSPFVPGSEVASLSANLIPAQTFVSQTECSGGGWSAVATSALATQQYALAAAFGWAGQPAHYAFLSSAVPVTITITAAATVVVGGYSIIAYPGDYQPKAWEFEGYTGSAWVTLDTRSNEVGWGTGERRTYTFINTTSYTQYRFIISASGSSGVYSGAKSIELYTATYVATVNYPGSVTLYQQRLLFGRTDTNPQTIFGSQTGNFQNFNTSRPLQDDDAIEFTLYSNQVNEIQWMTALRTLLIGSSGAEWEMTSGSNGGAISPTSVNVVSQGNRGSEPLQPITIGNSLLFVARGGNTIRDYGYNFDVDGYTGDELTVLASHLFELNEVRAWAYQRLPYSVIWCVTNDGKLYGLTYDKNQQVVGWHRHETLGSFESVASVSGTI